MSFRSEAPSLTFFVYAILRGLSAAMHLDLVLFGRIRSGPFFALLVKD